jgi:hypothetical protein
MHRFCLIYPLLSFGFFVLLIQKQKSFLGQSGNLSHASVSVFFSSFSACHAAVARMYLLPYDALVACASGDREI